MNRGEHLRARVAALRAAAAPTPELVDALNELANYLYPTQEAEARALVHEAEAHARALDYALGQGYARVTLGFMVYWRGDAASALEYAGDLWREYYTVEGADRLRGAIQELYAAAHHRMGQVGNALAHALNALDYYERALDRDGMATALNLIGICYGWLDDPRAATPYLERALALHLELQDDRRVVMMWGNLGWNYLRGARQHEAFEAITQCQQAYERYLESHGQAPYPDFPVYLAMNWAGILGAAGRADEAFRYIEQGKLANRRADGSLLTPALSCALLRVEGSLYADQGRWAETVGVLTEGLALAQEQGIAREQATLHEALAQAYKQIGKAALAFEHYRLFHALDKSLFSTRTAEEVARLRTTLETEAARREAEWLGRKQRELQSLVDELRELHAQVHELSIRDGLTGLFNRRYLDEELPRRVAGALESGMPVSVVMADIDNFKWINDRFRHQIGDEVLRVLARLAHVAITPDGTALPAAFVARYGGEELAFVLPGVSEGTARGLAESFCRAVETYAWETLEVGLSVTISVGVCAVEALSGTLHPEELLRRADEALYDAKRRGRNQVA